MTSISFNTLTSEDKGVVFMDCAENVAQARLSTLFEDAFDAKLVNLFDGPWLITGIKGRNDVIFRLKDNIPDLDQIIYILRTWRFSFGGVCSINEYRNQISGPSIDKIAPPVVVNRTSWDSATNSATNSESEEIDRHTLELAWKLAASLPKIGKNVVKNASVERVSTVERVRQSSGGLRIMRLRLWDGTGYLRK